VDAAGASGASPTVGEGLIGAGSAGKSAVGMLAFYAVSSPISGPWRATGSGLTCRNLSLLTTIRDPTLSQDNTPVGIATPAPQQQAVNADAASANGATAPEQNPYAAPRADVSNRPDRPAEVQSIKDIWLKPDGRIPRKAFWLYFCLPLVATGHAIFFLSPVLKTNALYWIYLVAVIYPCIVATIKRLHDRNFSGWWLLVLLLPGFVGHLILVAACCIRGTKGPNRFGGDATGMY
jgi:uncharacterized membrane protein YhaH (DUF805 family)